MSCRLGCAKKRIYIPLSLYAASHRPDTEISDGSIQHRKRPWQFYLRKVQQQGVSLCDMLANQSQATVQSTA